MFLVLLYNLLCKTFKDHSSTFAASLRSERNSLLQERCFPIASAKVEHFCIPCKRSPKKNARKFHLRPFCHFIALQNRQQSPFVRLSPTPPFSLPNLRFSRFSPFRTRFRAIFRGIALVFCPVKPTFFSSFLVLGPTSGDFREISPFIFPALLFSHSVNTFPIRVFPSFILCSTFIFQRQSFCPTITPSSSLHPPLSFSFLPTFPSSSPINTRTRTPSRTTRVRVHPHLLARQEVFVYCLHRFTHSSQSAVHQCVRCEGKREKAFTQHSITSQSTH